MTDRQLFSGLVTILALTSLLVACASAPPPPLPTVARAEAALEQGGQAVARDDWQRAQSLFQQADDLAASVDDSRTITIARLNLAWIAQQRGDITAAQTLLRSVGTGLPPDLSETVQLRLATLALAAADSKAAHALLTTHADTSSPMRLGLQARLAMLDGDFALAKNLAEGLDRDEIPIGERANGVRILARLAMQGGQAALAAKDARRCAEYDKSLGLSERLIEDLNLQAAAVAALGQNDDAALLSRRAQSIRGAWCRRFDGDWAPKQCVGP